MFEEFWKLYPRKVSKMMAHKAWMKLSTSEQAQTIEALPNHLAYWKATETEPQFIPYPGSWLNQHRFEDEIYIPQPKAEKSSVAWWSSESTVLAKGREIGLQPRPGESIHEFKGRIVEKLRMAA